MISTPFHPTPHSPSGGSKRGLLSSLKNRVKMGIRISHDVSAQLETMQDWRYIALLRIGFTI